MSNKYYMGYAALRRADEPEISLAAANYVPAMRRWEKIFICTLVTLAGTTLTAIVLDIIVYNIVTGGL